MCHLLGKVGLHDNMVVVAHGQVYPKMVQNKINYVDLPAVVAMVNVIEVLEPFDDLKIAHPRPECVTLGQSKGYCIMWPKTAIKLLATSTFGNDGCTGAGGDMAVDLDQPVGETLPPPARSFQKDQAIFFSDYGCIGRSEPAEG